MDRRAIGVFDSGVGGLTAMKVLEERLPNENILYFGDSGRMPYGGRTQGEIRAMSHEIAAFLDSCGVKAMLIACGTITTNAIESLRRSFAVPFFGVVDAACRACAERTVTRRVGVIATEASVRSGAYTRGITALDSGITVLEKACPPFARMVEDGHFRPGDALAEETVRQQLAPLSGQNIDTLLLGCTHYPLLSDILTAQLGPRVRLVSAGAEAAYELERCLRENELLTDAPVQGTRRFFTSGSTELFGRCAQRFLGHAILPEHHIL